MGIKTLINSFACKYYRKRIIKTAATVKGKVWIGGKTIVTTNTYLGNNVNFNGMQIYGKGKVTIGDNFHSGIMCQIITSFHDYEGSMIPYDKSYIDKDVVIEDNVWLGNNVIILGGVTIGEGAIIQAGSIVCKSVPPYAIAGGHPALPFKFRNKEHYDELKAKGMFY